MGVLKKIFNKAKDVVTDVAKVAINTVVPLGDPFKPDKFKTKLGSALNVGAKVFDKAATTLVSSATGINFNALSETFKALPTGGVIPGTKSTVTNTIIQEQKPSVAGSLLEDVKLKVDNAVASTKAFAKEQLNSLGQPQPQPQPQPKTEWYKTPIAIGGFVITGLLVLFGLFRALVAKKR